ncbi:MAG: OsmC family protein [Rhizomicrobium sp.]
MADLIGETIVIDETKAGKFQARVTSGSSTFLVDEPAVAGGLGSGPNPYDLLSAALGACTLMTVRLYADQKKWPLERVQVKVTHHRAALTAKDLFAKEIVLEGPLDEAQRARILAIAERCPVHLTLTRGSEVQTTIAPAPTGAEAATGCGHMEAMEEACRGA